MKTLILCLILTTVFSFESKAEHIRYTLKADIRGYIGVGGEINGIRNPTLKAEEGDKVSLTIININKMSHNIKLREHNITSDLVRSYGSRTTIEFIVKGADTYFCSLPGHEQAGMKGRLSLADSDTNPSPKDDIVKDPTDIPQQITRTNTEDVTFDIYATEKTAKLDENSTYTYWTYNGTVPGPMLRAKVGDDIEINLTNSSKSSMTHSIDFHAVETPHGGAGKLQVAPGETKTLRFTPKKAGLFIYHCASPHVPTHLAKGMYGMILIEPREGLSKVDKELYIVQGEYYTQDSYSFQGMHQHDGQRLLNENPSYIVMNGRPHALTEENAIKVQSGDEIRIFYGVGGPNLISSFHVIGEIFDTIYPFGSFDGPQLTNVQTNLVPAGGAAIYELRIDNPGHYTIVDHALSRMDKGATAKIIAE